jgi:small subunit ribosomal protein S6
MRRYELMLLLRPDLEDDKLQSAVEKVTRAIVNGGGSLSKVSPWGKRRLAYDIQRHREASYFLIHFDIEPGQVRDIERGLLISDEILRHLVTVIEDRGTVDEVPPAAAARTTDDADEADDADDSDEADDADGADEADEADEAEAVRGADEESEAGADAEGGTRPRTAADAPSGVADADDADAGDDDDSADEPAAVGERAEG